ncbi:MAG: SusC/RagA family TonB-linked outer membrane protein [Tenacibaculum sp.]
MKNKIVKTILCLCTVSINLKIKLTAILLIISFFNIQAKPYYIKTKNYFNFDQIGTERLFNKFKPISKFKLSKNIHVASNNNYFILSYITKHLPFTINSQSTIQQVQIRGCVVDIAGIPLPGVNIIKMGTQQGTQTDFDGKYIINANKGEQLSFSYLGMKTLVVTVGDKTNVNITLKEGANALEEVVVVGYGTQKKINIIGAVSSLKVEDVVQTPVTNTTRLLIGKIPGIITNQNPGLPGQDNVNLSIRGYGNPLVIVDGIESFLARVEPNDIETITVLKDASAAIYGARAGDGVILVTTKRGEKGKVQLNYHGYTGVQNPTKFPKQVNAAQFVQAKRNGAFNVQYDPKNPETPIAYGDFTEELLNQYQSGVLPSYSWVDALLRSSGGQIVSHNISARGGSEKIRFYTSIGMLNQAGIFNGNYDYKKITAANNLDARVTNSLSMALTGSYINETRDYASYGIDEIWNDLRSSSPFFPPSLPDPSRAPYSGFNERSPVARVQKKFGGYHLNTLETIITALEIKYNPSFLPGLTIGAKINIRYRRLYNERLNRSYKVWQYLPKTDEYLLQGSVAKNNFSKSYSTIQRLLSREYLNYKNNFGKHYLGVLAFLEKEDNTINSLSANRLNLLSSEVPTISAGDDALTITGGNGKPIEYTRVSAAGRLNYSYDKRYLFEATLRVDASSKHSPQVRWGYFPSVLLGWNIAKEKFMANTPFNELKPRFSYSETGKDDNIENTQFDFLTGFSEKGSVYYFESGKPTPSIQTTGLVNPLLTWEEVTAYNAGLDFSLFKNKIYGSFDTFYRLREGLLAKPTVNIPSTFGANLPEANLNSRNDHGFEILLGYKGNIGKDFKINISSTFGLARERFGKIQQDVDPNDPNQVRVNPLNGNYVNRIFGYISDGLFNTQQEVDDYLNLHTVETLNGTPKPGDIRYVDVNGPEGKPDGVINEYDLREIGYGSQPDMNYSLSTQFTYKKNLTLSLLWQGSSLFNVIISGMYRAPFDNEVVPLALHDKYSWVQNPNNPGIGSKPNAQLPAFKNDGGRIWNNNFSDFWLKDGTYLRLKTATLTYKLPKKVLDKIGLSNIKFYLTGDNLFVFTRLGIFDDVIDPEQAYNSGGFSLPLLRSFTFGTRIRF